MKKIILTSVLALFILSSCSYSQRTSKKLYAKSLIDKPYDAIVVPGFPFENNKWSKVSRDRIVWAAYLYNSGIAKNIIFSGSAVYTPYYESEIMKLYAIELGVREENIFTEKKAEHSTENVYYSNLLSKKLGFRKLALATDPFQSKMVKKFMDEHIDNTITLLPIQYDILEKIDTVEVNINPSTAFKGDFIPLDERESFWKRFQGTLGRNIDFNKTDY